MNILVVLCCAVLCGPVRFGAVQFDSGRIDFFIRWGSVRFGTNMPTAPTPRRPEDGVAGSGRHLYLIFFSSIPWCLCKGPGT